MKSSGPDSVVVLDPTEPRKAGEQLSPRLDSLNGKRLGLLWNGRRPGPGDKVLQGIAEALRGRYDIQDVVFMTKPFLGNMAPEGMLAEMASKVDAMLAGVGD